MEIKKSPKAHGEKGAWGVGATFISYGDIQEVLPDNVVTGASLSAKDISGNGFYSRDLSERWRLQPQSRIRNLYLSRLLSYL